MKDLEKKIWIAAEVSQQKIDPTNDNTDVIVHFSDNSRWVATFFTFKNIETLRRKNQETGEDLNGTYFWASDMVLIDHITRDCIEKVIDELLEVDIFATVFRRCDDEPYDEARESLGK